MIYEHNVGAIYKASKLLRVDVLYFRDVSPVRISRVSNLKITKFKIIALKEATKGMSIKL